MEANQTHIRVNCRSNTVTGLFRIEEGLEDHLNILERGLKDNFTFRRLVVDIAFTCGLFTC